MITPIRDSYPSEVVAAFISALACLDRGVRGLVVEDLAGQFCPLCGREAGTSCDSGATPTFGPHASTDKQERNP